MADASDPSHAVVVKVWVCPLRSAKASPRRLLNKPGFWVYPARASKTGKPLTQASDGDRHPAVDKIG